ncbi:MAG TPA: hypothetical protein VNN18_02495 [Candidatus Xenobia bacterium]|nr:hypothetical protein [Candidatus Xenobia bacterium]
MGDLAAGYLRGFRSYPDNEKGRWGFAFVPKRSKQVGMFAGFLSASSSRRGGPVLEPPECAVYVFVRPATSALHRKLVGGKQNLLRATYQRIVKYTARKPRWEFFERSEVVLARHVPLAAFPPDEQEKYARNFFIETLSLLVRSGLPAALQR